MAAIEEAFQGPFKHQDSPGSAWESRQVDHQFHTHCGVGESRYNFTFIMMVIIELNYYITIYDCMFLDHYIQTVCCDIN